MLAQFLTSRGETPLCIDTDPTNATFAGFKALNVRKLALLEDGDINPRNFDAMMELIAGSKEAVVVDSGASTYNPLSAYMFDNGVPEVIADLGHIATGCALSYLDFRFADEDWRAGHTALAAWHVEFEARPSVCATQ